MIPIVVAVMIAMLAITEAAAMAVEEVRLHLAPPPQRRGPGR